MRTSIRAHQNQINSHHALQSNHKFNLRQNSLQDNQKPDTSHIFMNRNNDQIFQDNIINFNQSNINQVITKEPKLKRKLNYGVFFVVVAAQLVYTVYPAIMFSRLNGEYQFFIMGFSLPVFYLIVSGYLLRDFGRFFPLYCLLDPLMVLVICLVGVYVIPYVLMGRSSVPEILQLVGFGLCNLAMVGNLRVMMCEMGWQSGGLIFFKLSKVLQVVFYLGFGAYYIIKQVSYSKGLNTNIDNKIQFIVLLFVLSGFSLQLMIFNKISDFDGTSQFITEYQIIDQPLEYYYANSNNNSNNNNGEVENIYYQQNSGINQSGYRNNNIKKPHYPSVTITDIPDVSPTHNNMSPTHNNSQIKIISNLSEIRKFQRKSARPSIDIR